MSQALPRDLADPPAAERHDSGSMAVSTAFKSPLKALDRHDLMPLEAMGQTGTVFATLDGTAVASSIDSTVERASFGPVGRSVTDVRRFHLATVFWLIPQRFARALRLS